MEHEWSDCSRCLQLAWCRRGSQFALQPTPTDFDLDRSRALPAYIVYWQISRFASRDQASWRGSACPGFEAVSTWHVSLRAEKL
jgi:hypothetical protein